MLTGPNVILVLKVAVAGVTVLLLASLVALWRRHYWLHRRITLVFLGLPDATPRRVMSSPSESTSIGASARARSRPRRAATRSRREAAASGSPWSECQPRDSLLRAPALESSSLAAVR